MTTKRQAVLTAVLLSVLSPQIALAQFSLGSLTDDPGNISFSSENLPIQDNYPPLGQAVDIGQSITSPKPDNSGSYTSGGLFQVDDIYQDAKDSKPVWFKDLFYGASDKRGLHPTTKKVFNILGHAQKGLKTYKLGRTILDGIKGKNPGSIVGGIGSNIGSLWCN